MKTGTASLMLLLSAAAHFQAVLGNPDSAPATSCRTMDPEHGFQAQNNSNTPYGTIPETFNIVRDQPLQLTLKSLTGSVPFRGYLLVALDPTQPPGVRGYVGSFSNPSDGQVFTCSDSGTANNAVSHSNNGDKLSVTVTWTPPPGWTGSVDFKTTFVKDTATYWINTYAAGIVNVRP